MGFAVRRTSRSYVRPSAATPSGTLELSIIDRVVGLGHLVRSLHVFAGGEPRQGKSSSSSPARVIREALGKALVDYYPLAGRIVDGAEGRASAHVECTGEGAWFVEAAAGFSLDDVGRLDLYPFAIPEDDLLPDAAPGVEPLDLPLMMQLSLDDIARAKSQFLHATGQRCSAFDVAAAKVWQSRTRSLRLPDPYCYHTARTPPVSPWRSRVSVSARASELQVQWIPRCALRATSKSLRCALPNHSRRTLLAPHAQPSPKLACSLTGPGPTCRHKTACAAACRLEPATPISLLPPRGIAGGDPPPLLARLAPMDSILRLDADVVGLKIAALLEVAGERRLSPRRARRCRDGVRDERPQRLSLRPAGLRTHYNPLCFFANTRHLLGNIAQQGFYGNCLYTVTVSAASGEVEAAELAGVVAMVREAEFARWAAGELVGEDPYELPFAYEALFVSDWTRLGFLEADYGWGTPEQVVPFAYHPCMPIAIIGWVTTRCVEEENVKEFREEMKAFHKETARAATVQRTVPPSANHQQPDIILAVVVSADARRAIGPDKHLSAIEQPTGTYRIPPLLVVAVAAAAVATNRYPFHWTTLQTL
ncbi:hypothetical protein HU200_056813 [Digitaria exilis]|uniref:Uncharacterized protein n=1 Tax=Digitaria exilis TaxID=1010633 RepID=A0A835E5M7_9POAL|nr:hypothetical protein HU200_056813 [Digitaria exilis]